MIKKIKNRFGKEVLWKHGCVEPYDPYGSCYDCDSPYKQWPDLRIPNKLWESINPSVFRGGGLLCPSCLVHRLSFIGKNELEIKIGCYSG